MEQNPYLSISVKTLKQRTKEPFFSSFQLKSIWAKPFKGRLKFYQNLGAFNSILQKKTFWIIRIPDVSQRGYFLPIDLGRLSFDILGLEIHGEAGLVF